VAESSNDIQGLRSKVLDCQDKFLVAQGHVKSWGGLALDAKWDTRAANDLRRLHETILSGFIGIAESVETAKVWLTTPPLSEM